MKWADYLKQVRERRENFRQWKRGEDGNYSAAVDIIEKDFPILCDRIDALTKALEYGLIRQNAASSVRDFLLTMWLKEARTVVDAEVPE